MCLSMSVYYTLGRLIFQDIIRLKLHEGRLIGAPVRGLHKGLLLGAYIRGSCYEPTQGAPVMCLHKGLLLGAPETGSC